MEKYHGKPFDASVLICGTDMKDVNTDIKDVIEARAKVETVKCPERGELHVQLN